MAHRDTPLPALDSVRPVTPLTPLQSGMLLHHLEGLEGVDIEQIVVSTPELLNPTAIEAALQELAARHPMLRTRFVWDGLGEPFSEELAGVTIPFTYLRNSCESKNERDEQLSRFLAQDRLAGLDLSQAPLLRGTLWEFGQQNRVLVLTIHHAIVDGRCFPKLLTDLFALIQHPGSDANLTPTTPTFPFARFAHWIHEQDFRASSLPFWKSLLQGFTAPTPLTVDDLPDATSLEQQIILWQDEISLTKEETSRCENLASATGTTVHSVVQSAWALLLSKYSGEDDVVFGGTRACRKSSFPEVEDAMGLFINTLPVRARTDADRTVSELLMDLRTQWLAMRDHEHTPLALIQSNCDLARGQRLFHSIVVFETFDLGERMKSLGGDWSQRQVDLYEKTNFPLTLAAYHGTQLRLKLEFDPKRFSKATVRRVLGHLRHLLLQLTGDAQAKLGSLELMPKPEAQELSDLWASPRNFPVPGTLVEMFEAQVERTPEHIALSYQNQQWTYRELNTASNDVADALLHHPAYRSGAIIGLCVDRSPEVVIGILGILKTGSAYLPIDLAYPAERLQWMMEDAAAPILLTQQALLGQLPESAAVCLSFEEIPANGTTTNPPYCRDLDSLAYVIFTSGSTGKPKGCRVTHRNVVRLMTSTEEWFHFHDADVWTLFHSFAFDFSVWEIWGPLLYGGRLVVVPYDTTRSPSDFYALMARERVTVLNQTPSAFRQIIEVERLGGEKLPALSLRTVIFGGEALELESLRPWFERHGDQEPQLINMYGITETTVHVTYRPICRNDLKGGSVIGIPIPDLEIHLRDPQGHAVPLGVPGEIFVGGAGVAAGYLNRPELTAERFLPHPTNPSERLYRTGDVARFLPGGDLEYLGRCDDQVKIRGFRIELGEIQAVLVRHPAVREAFVTVDRKSGHPQIVAYLVGDRDAVDLAELRRHAGTAMPPYMIPAAILFLDQFPLTNNGKIDRRALPSATEALRQLDRRGFVAPSSATEKILASIWSRVLKLDQISRHDHYFELGGDSILSIQTVTSARELGYNLTPRDLFDHPVLSELSEVAEKRRAADMPSVTAPLLAAKSLSLEEPAPLTPIQEWFFHQEGEAVNHWNQAFLFTSRETLDPERLRLVLGRLIELHPALRTRFVSGAQQIGTGNFVLNCHEKACDEGSLQSACDEAQRSLDIHKGRLLAAVSFASTSSEPARLFLAIHHLAVDGVSWRILMEDLAALYQGKDPAAPSDSFVHWAHHLASLRQSPEWTDQVNYWRSQAIPDSLPGRHHVGPTRVREARSFAVSLTPAETAALLTEIPGKLRCQINEVLVASLALALRDWTGRENLAFDLESHGRQEVSGYDHSRTVGWFTTLAPLSLNIAKNATPHEALRIAKEALRARPDQGFGFGLLGLDVPTRDVVFNYLGQFDRVLADNALFQFDSTTDLTKLEKWYDPDSARHHLVEVNAWVKEGAMTLAWTFADLPEAAVRHAAQTLVAVLGEFIALDCPAKAWAVSDFPLAQLRSTDLDRLSVRANEIEDILPLTPLQQLYYTLEVARPGSGLDQWHWSLSGEIDPEALREAWHTAIDRHAVLRTTFFGERMLGPVQIVQTRGSVEIPITIVDWREEDFSEERFERLLRENEAQGLSLESAPLMRLILVRIKQHSSRLIWTHHHLQVDGWSWPLIIAQVAEAYGSITGSTPLPQATAAKSVRDYLRWFHSKDHGPARHFWSERLAGLKEPTPLPGTPRPAQIFREFELSLTNAETKALGATARELACPLNCLVQAAWSLLLARQCGREEITYGVTYSGRSPEMVGVSGIVGTFVNNLPLRVPIRAAATLAELARQLHREGTALSEHQQLPLTEIQQLSEVPLRQRLFESLLVFQNYEISDSSKQWGPHLRMEKLHAPVRTNYPLTLVAIPGDALRLTLIAQQGRFDTDYPEQVLSELVALLRRFGQLADSSLASIVSEIQLPTISVLVTTTPRLATSSPPVTPRQQQIAAVWRQAFGITGLGIDDNFFDLGGHSLLLVQVYTLLRGALAEEISLVDVFANPTIRSLATALEPKVESTSVAPLTLPSQHCPDQSIAIIGLSGRFPGAETVAEFWSNLVEGVESILSYDDDQLRAEGLDPERMRAAGDYVARRGQLPDPDCFDAAFFDISPREATVLDPQQRLFLETAWNALEDAAYTPSRFAERIGVYAGMSNNTYYEQYVRPDDLLREQLGDLTVMMGQEKDYLATRTAYKLNLRGPALNIYTACSTSLVAVAEAIYSLRAGRCEMALAGAVSLTFPQNRGYYYEEGGILSPDGVCRPYDSRAAGTVFSNGAAVVVLKPLQTALANGDTIHAVIRGVGLNNDGSDKVSFTAPSVAGQRDAIVGALQDAGISPESIGFVEGHGTGTTLGDPIEVAALTAAYRQFTSATRFCALGSVKANIGHLDAASGMAGLVKATLAVREGFIPATPHTHKANVQLRLDESPFTLLPEARTWSSDDGGPRRAGVSSFGVGGTNAHLILEEAPQSSVSTPSPRTAELLVLSAKTESALTKRRRQLADQLEQNPDLSLADVAYTLAVGRETFRHRFSVAVSSRPQAITALREGHGLSRENTLADLPVTFLIPGQGNQFAGMGQELYEREAVFRECFDRGAEHLLPLLQYDLREVIFSPGEAHAAILRDTQITQPALVLIACALGELWRAHGVVPARVMGHSVGEYAAAWCAGVFSLEDTLSIVCTRGRLASLQPNGAMLSVRLDEKALSAWLRPSIEIAALNSPVQTILAGPSEAIADLSRELTDAGISNRLLETSHAFHSASMESMLPAFIGSVASYPTQAPQIPWIATHTAQWMPGDMAPTPAYWRAQTRGMVRFSDSLRLLAESGTNVLIELGPGRSGVSMAKHTLADKGEFPSVISLPHVEDGPSCFLELLGELWASGGTIDWNRFFANENRRRLSLPTYPFERVRHWPESRELVLPLAARCLQTNISSAQPNAMPATIIAPEPTVQPAAIPLEAITLDRRDRLVAELCGQIHGLTGSEVSPAATATTFFDLGLDSLLIGQAATVLSRHFGTRITFRHLMDEHDSVSRLAEYLDRTLPPTSFAATASLPKTTAMVSAAATVQPSAGPTTGNYAAGELHRDGASSITFGPFRPVATTPDQSLTSTQQAHLDALIVDYSRRYTGSRTHIAKHRQTLADPRAAAGFSLRWKEMVHPIVTDRSSGAYLWDIDGHRWIDVTHGFGLGLFGHKPPFVTEALTRQLEAGFEIGPASPLAGVVAEQLCRLSGKDRVTFCNTGSEAVTAAIRVARTVSQRDKIAVFKGSYHGIFDEVLGRPLVKNGMLATAPIAPGLPDSHLANVLILDYGNPESLSFIERYADELAAVLVEPVQSRRPDHQPREFLHALREVTARHDIALVFDEVVTGFRCHPGGAQAYFGIDADLVSYGKVLGGGLPIGALAGRKAYMDALDGGAWNLGDDSGPTASVTFFAGTFVRHPLALAAAHAILTEIEKGGTEPQAELDCRTAAFVERCNAFCESVGVPIKMTRFSSMYYIETSPELRYTALLFFHLRLRGIHIWETRPSFLSLAHTEADIEAIYQAWCESILALQEGDFLPRKDDEQELALTPEQEELLLASLMGAEQSRAYHESVSFILEGSLDRPALARSFAKLVARHEGLRTTFLPESALQIIHDPADFVIPIEEVDGTGQANDLDVLRKQCFARAFDLASGPLLRAVLIHLGEKRQELLLVAHHLVCDGRSFGVIYDDLVALYDREIASSNEELPRLPKAASFREHLHRRTDPASLAESKEDAAYWVGEMIPLPPVLSLPRDHVSEMEHRFDSDTVSLVLSDEINRMITELCQARKLTPFTLLFAAYRDILGRLSGQNDFCIGTPVSDTNSPGLVGHGVHFLPIRCRDHQASSIAEYLTENRNRVLDALDHQSSTLSEILRGLPDGQRLDPIHTTFTLESQSPERHSGDLRWSLQGNAKPYANFDLSLVVLTDEGRYSLHANFHESILDARTVLTWLELLARWVEAVYQASPEDAMGTLALTPPRSDRSIARLNEAAAINRAAGRSLAELFAETAKAHPDCIALCSHGVRRTYEELDLLSHRVAHCLRQDGLQPGDRVLLLADRSTDLIIVILGLVKCGAVYVPVDPQYPDARIAELKTECDPRLVLDETAIHKLVSTAQDARYTQTSLDPLVTSSPEDLAYIMFTSGSTGRPKGVMIPQRGITRLVRDSNYLAIRPDDIFLLAAPCSFDASTLEIWGPLLNGACLAIPPRGALTLAELAQSIEDFGVSVLWLTAGLFQLMADEHVAQIAQLRVLLAGGDVLPPAAVRSVLEHCPTTSLINGYGPTENTTFTCCHLVNQDDLARPSIPIGRPITGTSVYVLDAAGRELAPGLPGELCTGGFGLGLGYWRQPELTREKFITHPRNGERLYRTGDRCRLSPDGLIEFLGRLDQQVKIRGFRIEPQEVEAAVLNHPGVGQCRVLVCGSGSEEKQLVACCVAPAHFESEIRERLARTMPRYLQPEAYLFVDRMPLGPNGKINDSALREQIISQSRTHPSRSLELVPPTNESEERLYRLWCELLGRSDFGIDDRFFDVGGHSLLGLRLFARLKTEIGFSKPLAVLFECPTIRSFAPLLTRLASDEDPDSECLALLRSGKTDPTLFLIHGGDGGILFYEDFAAALPHWDGSVYAIESPALTSEAVAVPPMEEIVTLYLKLIQDAQATGAYHIGGYSGGGLIAFELSKRLEKLGHPTRLILFDTANPATERATIRPLGDRLKAVWKKSPDASKWKRFGDVVHHLGQGIQSKLRHHRSIHRCEALRRRGELLDPEDRTFFINELHSRQYAFYVPTGRLREALLIQASDLKYTHDLPRHYGWDPSLISNLEIRDVPCDHHGMFQPPTITEVAAQTARYLRTDRVSKTQHTVPGRLLSRPGRS